MMAADTAYSTVADVLAELGLSAASAAEELFLRRSIAAATARINAYCGRDFAAAPRSDLAMPAAPAAALRLRHWPVVTVTALDLDGRALDPAGAGLAEGRYLTYQGGWPPGRALTVSYLAGYRCPGVPEASTPAPPLPGDIEQACVDLVRLRWFARDRDPALRSERLFDLTAKTWSAQGGDSDPSLSVLATLDSYVRVDYA